MVTPMLSKGIRGKFISHILGIATAKPSQAEICMHIHLLALLPTKNLGQRFSAKILPGSLLAARVPLSHNLIPYSVPAHFTQRYSLSVQLLHKQIRDAQPLTSDS